MRSYGMHPIRLLGVIENERLLCATSCHSITVHSAKPLVTSHASGLRATNSHSRFYGNPRLRARVLPARSEMVTTLITRIFPFARLQSFHGIRRGSFRYWPNPSISVAGAQQDWFAFALRRQRSHVRIVSGAPFTPEHAIATYSLPFHAARVATLI